jgi:hypothetical protein
MPVLPVVPTRKCCAVCYLRFELFHGMEEIEGPALKRHFHSGHLEGSTALEAGISSSTIRFAEPSLVQSLVQLRAVGTPKIPVRSSLLR